MQRTHGPLARAGEIARALALLPVILAGMVLIVALAGCSAREASPTTGRQLTAEQLVAEQAQRSREIADEAAAQVREQERAAQAKARELEQSLAEAARRRQLLDAEFARLVRGAERQHEGALDELRQRWAESGAEVDATIEAARRRAENAAATIAAKVDAIGAEAQARADREKLAYEQTLQRLAEKQRVLAGIGDFIGSPAVQGAVGTLPGGALLTGALGVAAYWLRGRQHQAADKSWDEGQAEAARKQAEADRLYDEARREAKLEALHAQILQLLAGGKAGADAAAQLTTLLRPDPPAPTDGESSPTRPGPRMST